MNTAKQKDGLTSFMLSVLEAKIFQYGFVEEHKVCENNSQHREIKSRLWRLNQNFWSPRLIALLIVSCIGDRIGRTFEHWDGY